jgi:hypothetical protein
MIVCPSPREIWTSRYPDRRSAYIGDTSATPTQIIAAFKDTATTTAAAIPLAA